MARRASIPGLAKSAEIRLADQVQQLETRLSLLEAVPKVPEVQTSNFAAREGQFVVVEAPPAGLVALLPKPRPQNRGRRITFSFKNSNPVRFMSVDGLVNNQTSVVSTRPGTFDAISDGETGWFIDQSATATGSATDATYFLETANVSLPNARVGTDSTEIDVDYTVASLVSWSLRTASVVFSKLQNLTGLSVLGRAANSSGVMAAITAGAAAQYLRSNSGGTSLEFGNPASTSIINTSGQFQRAALTGAVTATQDSNTTTFGALAAKSVLANATNASAVPAALAGSAAFQHLRVNSANTGLEWSVLTTGDFPNSSVPVAALANIGADTFLGNVTGGSAPVTANSLVTLAGAGLAYAAGVMSVNVTSPITIATDSVSFDQTVALGNNARVAVRKNSGATVGTRRAINFIEGSSITLTIADDAGNEEVDVTIASTASGGGSSPVPGLVLSATNQSLEVVSTTAATLHFEASFEDLLSGALTPGSQTGSATSGTNALVSAPAASTQRTVVECTIINVDASVSQQVSVQKNTGGTLRELLADIILFPNERIEFTADQGWRVFDTQGRERKVGIAPTTIVQPGGRLGVSIGSATAGPAVALTAAQSGEDIRFDSDTTDNPAAGPIASWAPHSATTTTVRVNGGNDTTIQGIAAPAVSGQRLTIKVDNGAGTGRVLRLSHSDAGATSTEQIRCPSGLPVVLTRNDVAIVEYNANRWHVVSVSTTGSKFLAVQTIIATGTYTPTLGTKTCRVTVIGGGAGGGGCSNTAAGTVSIGAGGAPGSVFQFWWNLPVATSVTINAGGTGGAANSAAAGGVGGTTQFGTLICQGGLAGFGDAGAGAVPRISQPPGSNNGFGGTIPTGGVQIMRWSGSGGVGFGATNASNGTWGGPGGIPMGPFANIQTTTATPTVSQTFGQGGNGGNARAGTAGVAGQAGAAGCVIIEEFA